MIQTATLAPVPTYWYLAQTKPRQEDVALQNLERQAYLAKLPRVRALRRSSGAKGLDAIQVLFPGYFFSRLRMSISRLLRSDRLWGSAGWFGLAWNQHRSVVLLEIMAKVQTLGFDLGQLDRS